MPSYHKRKPSTEGKRRGGRRCKLIVASLGTLLCAGYLVYVRHLLRRHHESMALGELSMTSIGGGLEQTEKYFLNSTLDQKDAKQTKTRTEGNEHHHQREYHIVFSTSCSDYQEWQSTVFFYFANKVKQPGKITRIVSGCKTDDHLQVVVDNFNKRIAPLSPNFALHAAPNFDFTKEHTKYMNKPYGVLHWMEKELGYSSEEKSTVHDDSIIFLMDPDMILLKPITHSFDTSFPSWIKATSPIYTEVDHGRPIAQQYGFGWYQSINQHLREVVLGDKDAKGTSPIFNMTSPTEQARYNAGPPYLATGRDFYQIVSKWVDVAPRVHKVFHHFMAEMHSYAVAAAHVGLPHQLTKKFMISNANVISEGWDFLRDVDRKDACRPDTTKYIDRMPYVLHYCQRYSLGRWFVGKYQLPEGMLHDCKAALLRRPQSNVGAELDWFTYANGREHQDLSRDEMRIKMNAFSMCTMMDDVNEVATSMRQTHCSTEDANYNETHIFVERNIFDEFLLNPVEAAAVREGK